jgi:SNF2 family DNA or RNA helicase
MDMAVVCPVSIVGQWANEVKSKLAANLSIYMYHGSKRYEHILL